MTLPRNTIYESDFLHVHNAHCHAFPDPDSRPEVFNSGLLRALTRELSVQQGAELIEIAVRLSRLIQKYPQQEEGPIFLPGDREEINTLTKQYKDVDDAVRNISSDNCRLADIVKNSQDYYGRPLDQKGTVIFAEFATQCWCLTASDANIAMDLKEYDFRNLTPKAREIQNVPITCKVHPVVTSPNVNFVPPFSLGQRTIKVGRNGGFGKEDFTRNPQLYNHGSPHLPFGFRRPLLDDIRDHEWSSLWWTVKPCHFERQDMLTPGELGRLKTDISTGCIHFLEKIVSKVLSFCNDTPGLDTTRMRASCNVARSTILRLCTTNLTFNDVVIQVALFQRQCWEILAWLNFFSIGVPCAARVLSVQDAFPIADLTLMGCLVEDVDTCDMMARMTVPVWLIRGPWDVPSDIAIHRQVFEYMEPDFPDEFAPCEDPDSARVFGRSSAPADWARTIQRVMPMGFQLDKASFMPRLTFDELEFAKKDRLAKEAFLAFMRPQTSERRPAASTSTAERQSCMSTANIPRGQYPPSGFYYRPEETPGNIHGSGTFHNVRVDDAKFKVPQSSLFPSPLPVWARALESVDFSLKRLKENHLYSDAHGYMFPPPTIFLKDRDTAVKTVFVWLSVRRDWISRIDGLHDACLRVPRPIEWRTYFHQLSAYFFPRPAEASFRARDGPPPKKKARSMASGSNRRNLSQKITDDVFNVKEIQKLARPEKVEWNSYILGDSLEELLARHDSDFQGILWELSESLFRRELEVLDRSIMTEVWRDEVGAAERESLIFKVFPFGNGYTVSGLAEVGIAADSEDARAPYVEALREVIAGWNGAAAEELRGLSVGSYDANGNFKFQSNELFDVKWRVAFLYCQSFFDFAGRAPTIPMSVPKHFQVESKSRAE